MIVLSFVFFLSGKVFAANEASFSEANTKYQSGDFKGAAELYEKAVGAGERSGSLYYNLGNTYFRVGKKGQALAAYERAKLLLPRDKDIEWNMNILKSVLTDRLEAPDDNIAVFWLKEAAAKLTLDELAASVMLLLSIFLLMILVTLLLPRLRLLPQFIQVLIVPVAALAIVLFAFKWWNLKEPRVVVLDKEIYAHYGPSQKETKAFLLHEGAEARVLDESKDWIYITLDNKSSGWIPRASCEVI